MLRPLSSSEQEKLEDVVLTCMAPDLGRSLLCEAITAQAIYVRRADEKLSEEVWSSRAQKNARDKLPTPLLVKPRCRGPSAQSEVQPASAGKPHGDAVDETDVTTGVSNLADRVGAFVQARGVPWRAVCRNRTRSPRRGGFARPRGPTEIRHPVPQGNCSAAERRTTLAKRSFATNRRTNGGTARTEKEHNTEGRRADPTRPQQSLRVSSNGVGDGMAAETNRGGKGGMMLLRRAETAGAEVSIATFHSGGKGL